MFDFAIRTRTGARYDPLSIPFDWAAFNLSSPPTVQVAQAARAGHDFSNCCSLVISDVQMLDVVTLELEDTLQSAVLISVFCDARAGKDDVLPRGQTDRRGWPGSELVRPLYQNASGQAGNNTLSRRAREVGSLLWLYLISKTTLTILELARFACWESLQWMVETKVAQRIEVFAAWIDDAGRTDSASSAPQNRLSLRIQIYKPNIQSAVYDVVWAFTLKTAVNTHDANSF